MESKEDKASYYMVIPATVWSANLRDKAKLCYGIITVLANKTGYCYANNAYFAEQLGVSRTTVSQYISELKELGVITTNTIYKEGTKEVDKRLIYIASIGIKDNFNGPIKENLKGPIKENFKDNTTSTNNTSINITESDKSDSDAERLDKIKNLYWKKLIPAYPTNRIGNRQHGLKKWLDLEDKEMVLAIKNMDRYLKLAGSYVKTLQNYLDQRCFTEEWLGAEAETKQTKNHTTKDTKTFSGNYDDID